MTKISRDTILENAASLFARNGSDGFSIRKLAKEIPITPSVIYHYFADEDSLLLEMFKFQNHLLGQKRAQLKRPRSAKQMLRQRIEFQIDNQESIVAVLKYYLTYRYTFPKFKNGYVPEKSALHIEEVLTYGIETGEFYVIDLADDAKVITHAINGFLLEYFPHIPSGKEKKELIDRIYNFLIRAIERR